MGGWAGEERCVRRVVRAASSVDGVGEERSGVKEATGYTSVEVGEGGDGAEEEGLGLIRGSRSAVVASI